MTLRLLLIVAALLLITSTASAQYVKILGVAEKSGTATVSGIASSNKPSITFPGATITILTPDNTNATIYSDSQGTSKSNPFTASLTDATYDFFISPGAVFSVRISGTSGGVVITPFTRSGYTAPGVPGQTLVQCSGTNDTSLLTTASAIGGTILIAKGTTCASNSQTLSAALQVDNGGLLKPLNSQTVTLTGPQIGGTWQRFTNATAGLGTVSFSGNTSVQTYLPQWWGGAGDGVTASATAIQAAINAVPSGGTLAFPNGVYLISSSLTITNPILLQGEGTVVWDYASPENSTGPRIKLTGSATSVISVGTGAARVGPRFDNLILDGNSLATYVVKANRWWYGGTDRVAMIRPVTAAMLIGSSSTTVNEGSSFNKFVKSWFQGPIGINFSTFDGGTLGAFNNEFYDCVVDYTGAYGTHLANGDSNKFYNLGHLQRAGTGPGLYTEPKVDVNSSFANFFVHLDAGIGGFEVAAGNDDAGTILGYQRGDGQPTPVIGAGSALTWTEMGGGWATQIATASNVANMDIQYKHIGAGRAVYHLLDGMNDQFYHYQFSNDGVPIGALGNFGDNANDVSIYTGSTLIKRFTWDSAGNIAMGTGGLATNAVDGFFLELGMNGVPTGIPNAASTYPQRIPTVVDFAHRRVYYYMGSEWRYAALNGGSAPTLAAGTAAGTTPTLTIDSTSTDISGLITLTPGTTPPTGNNTVFTLTFAVAMPVAPKSVTFTPANSIAAALSGAAAVYVEATSTTTAHFVVNVFNTALDHSSTYKWYYQVNP